MAEKIKKIGKHSTLYGSIFVVFAAFITYSMVFVVYNDVDSINRLGAIKFDCGIDVICALISAALYFGCMGQEGNWARAFRTLNVLVSAGFVINFMFCYTTSVPYLRGYCFVYALISKLIDLGMIYFFYQYMKRTLEFKGRLALFAKKVFPILLILENIVILSNIFYPVTFFIDGAGVYQATDISILEDIYLATASLITAILIIRSENPKRQKVAGMTFICMPLINYVAVGGTFGNASQYGMILVSLIIMYSIIFSNKSSKLAATQNELNMATEIQASMLPSIFPPFPQREEFDLYASMDPAREVGGDIVQNYAMMGISAAEVLRRSNDSICAQNKMKMFVTTWIGILELSTGKMNCASAGHEYPALYHDGKFELYHDKRKIALGARKGREYIDYEIQLSKNDKIFVYTDGVPEATNANKELFGTDRMIDALNTNPEADTKEILRMVRASVDEFVGNAEQFDDLTMLCVEYRGAI